MSSMIVNKEAMDIVYRQITNGLFWFMVICTAICFANATYNLIKFAFGYFVDNSLRLRRDTITGKLKYVRLIKSFSQWVWIGCDGNCSKAFGISERPRVFLSDDPDDFCYLPDQEIDQIVPDFQWQSELDNPTRWPIHPKLCKWCVRECERSTETDWYSPHKLFVWDFSKPFCNMPNLHVEENNKQEETKQ